MSSDNSSCLHDTIWTMMIVSFMVYFYLFIHWLMFSQDSPCPPYNKPLSTRIRPSLQNTYKGAYWISIDKFFPPKDSQRNQTRELFDLNIFNHSATESFHLASTAEVGIRNMSLESVFGEASAELYKKTESILMIFTRLDLHSKNVIKKYCQYL